SHVTTERPQRSLPRPPGSESVQGGAAGAGGQVRRLTSPMGGRSSGLPGDLLAWPSASGIILAMSEVTTILAAIDRGDPRAASELLPLVYDELRQLAAARLADEKPGQTLQPTALVHEAYLRLVGDGQPRDWNSRGHFFAAAAEAMRRILINRA